MTKINDDWLCLLLCFCLVIVPVTFVTSCMLPFTVKLEPTNKNNNNNNKDHLCISTLTNLTHCALIGTFLQFSTMEKLYQIYWTYSITSPSPPLIDFCGEKYVFHWAWYDTDKWFTLGFKSFILNILLSFHKLFLFNSNQLN